MPLRRNKNNRTNPPKRRPRRTAAPQQPLWSLDRDGITFSGLQQWQQCPEQFALHYMEGLVHKKLKESLVFGSLFHACAEHRGKLSPMEAMAGYRDRAVLTHENDMEYMHAVDHLIHKVAAIFPAYEARYPLKKEPTSVRTEQSFAVPVTVQGVTFDIRGKRDGELAARNNQIAIREIKTKSTIDPTKIRYLLKADLQTLIYLWSVWKETGKVPAYLLYDVIKRPTLKVTKNESLQDHYKRVAEHALDNQNMYFFRWKIDPITETDLVRFEKEILLPTLRAFVSWWLEVRKYPFDRFQGSLHHLNLSALSNPYIESEYYDLLILGNRKNYFVQSSPHPELTE